MPLVHIQCCKPISPLRLKASRESKPETKFANQWLQHDQEDCFSKRTLRKKINEQELITKKIQKRVVLELISEMKEKHSDRLEGEPCKKKRMQHGKYVEIQS